MILSFSILVYIRYTDKNENSSNQSFECDHACCKLKPIEYEASRPRKQGKAYAMNACWSWIAVV